MGQETVLLPKRSVTLTLVSHAGRRGLGGPLRLGQPRGLTVLVEALVLASQRLAVGDLGVERGDDVLRATDEGGAGVDGTIGVRTRRKRDGVPVDIKTWHGQRHGLGNSTAAALLTGEFLEPEPLLSIWDVLVVDLAGKQRRVDGAEAEGASRLEFLGTLHVDETGQLERHQGLVERSVVARECFPEGSCAGRRDSLEAHAH